MGHIVLLGDSILDNRAYVAGGPAVIDQLRQSLPQEWQATLLAIDGSVTFNVPQQLNALPSDASHLFISAGGNDALFQISVLQQQVRTVGEALARLAQVQEQFEASYRAMLHEVLQADRWTAVCTIYNPAYPDAALQQVSKTGLVIFNDAILRIAAEHRLPVLDLRRVCISPKDYANPIEPSSAGGAKIAQAILRMALESSQAAQTRIYP